MSVPRFVLITESDARRLEPGSTVELEPGGKVTPLAQDTLAARRITVVAAGSVDHQLPADLAPAWPITRVAIGSDHTGVALKATLVAHLRGSAVAVSDLGTSTTDPVDYPDIALEVARAVVRGEADAGIVIDGAGIASAMAANKVTGARAAMCSDVTLARYAREHMGANVLALGSTLVTGAQAREITDAWMGVAMREARYIRRLLKVRRIETGR